MNSEIQLSPRIAAVRPSATLAVSARAAELRAAGKSVLNFAAGEPDFKPPRAVREAVAGLVADAAMRYAPVPGLPQLREAVADELSVYHDLKLTRDHVLVSCGAKHSLANLFLVTLDDDDEVLIPSPYWVSYPDMVRIAGGIPVVVETTAEQQWRLRPEALEPLLTDKTKFLVLNSPSNPTGVGYREQDIRAIGEVLARKAPHAWIVCDDIYRKLVYGDFHHVSAVRALRGITDRIVLVDGISKSHAMTGYRVGFLAGPPKLIKGATAIQGQMTSGAATPSQLAAHVALTDDSCVAEVDAMRQAFTRRRALVLEGLSKAEGVRVIPPDGAFYVFADVSAHCGRGKRFADDVTLATWLLEEELVATVPGTAFGAPGHLRLSYATDDSSLQEGAARIVDALGKLP